MLADDIGTFQNWKLLVYGTSNTAVMTVPSTSISLPKSSAYRLTWGPLRSTSDIRAYDIRVREAYAAWRTWKTNTATRASTFYGTPGRTYYFSIRTRHRDGSISAYSTPRPLVIPQNDRAARYGGRWTVRRGTSTYYMGAARVTQRYRSWAKLSFRGRKIALIATLGPRRAPAQVYIDGRRVGTVPTIASRIRYRRLSKSFAVASPRRLHTLMVYHGDRRAGHPLEIDGFYIQQ